MNLLKSKNTPAVIELLKQLIAIPSLSKEEDRTADCLANFLTEQGISPHRHLNNVWAINQYFDANKPSFLLNSHHDTVKPNKGYTNPPFEPIVKGDQLFGLGSNDAGGPLVSLLGAFLHFYAQKELPFNLIWAATAEEEISGKQGIASLIEKLPNLSFAIVGEPTQMQVATAEKGLMVLDCIAKGKAGHAARDEGENAIYKAMQDIAWFQHYQFPKISEMLGPVKMSVTVIEAGKQHNVVPEECCFVVDVRTTDAYSNVETLEIIQQHVAAEVKVRSTRLNPSGVSIDHPFVKEAVALGRKTYGSPTLSDQALISIPSMKMGPGDSARSHTANEFILLSEIEEGIELYIKLLENVIARWKKYESYFSK